MSLAKKKKNTYQVRKKINEKKNEKKNDKIGDNPGIANESQKQFDM